MSDQARLQDLWDELGKARQAHHADNCAHLLWLEKQPRVWWCLALMSAFGGATFAFAVSVIWDYVAVVGAVVASFATFASTLLLMRAVDALTPSGETGDE